MTSPAGDNNNHTWGQWAWSAIAGTGNAISGAASSAASTIGSVGGELAGIAQVTSVIAKNCIYEGYMKGAELGVNFVAGSINPSKTLEKNKQIIKNMSGGGDEILNILSQASAMIVNDLVTPSAANHLPEGFAKAVSAGQSQIESVINNLLLMGASNVMKSAVVKMTKEVAAQEVFPATFAKAWAERLNKDVLRDSNPIDWETLRQEPFFIETFDKIQALHPEDVEEKQVLFARLTDWFLEREHGIDPQKMMNSSLQSLLDLVGVYLDKVKENPGNKEAIMLDCSKELIRFAFPAGLKETVSSEIGSIGIIAQLGVPYVETFIQEQLLEILKPLFKAQVERGGEYSALSDENKAFVHRLSQNTASFIRGELGRQNDLIGNFVKQNFVKLSPFMQRLLNPHKETIGSAISKSIESISQNSNSDLWKGVSSLIDPIFVKLVLSIQKDEAQISTLYQNSPFPKTFLETVADKLYGKLVSAATDEKLPEESGLRALTPFILEQQDLIKTVIKAASLRGALNLMMNAPKQVFAGHKREIIDLLRRPGFDFIMARGKIREIRKELVKNFATGDLTREQKDSIDRMIFSKMEKYKSVFEIASLQEQERILHEMASEALGLISTNLDWKKLVMKTSVQVLTLVQNALVQIKANPANKDAVMNALASDLILFAFPMGLENQLKELIPLSEKMDTLAPTLQTLFKTFLIDSIDKTLAWHESLDSIVNKVEGGAPVLSAVEKTLVKETSDWVAKLIPSLLATSNTNIKDAINNQLNKLQTTDRALFDLINPHKEAIGDFVVPLLNQIGTDPKFAPLWEGAGLYLEPVIAKAIIGMRKKVKAKQNEPGFNLNLANSIVERVGNRLGTNPATHPMQQRGSEEFAAALSPQILELLGIDKLPAPSIVEDALMDFVKTTILPSAVVAPSLDTVLNKRIRVKILYNIAKVLNRTDCKKENIDALVNKVCLLNPDFNGDKNSVRTFIVDLFENDHPEERVRALDDFKVRMKGKPVALAFADNIAKFAEFHVIDDGDGLYKNQVEAPEIHSLMAAIMRNRGVKSNPAASSAKSQKEMDALVEKLKGPMHSVEDKVIRSWVKALLNKAKPHAQQKAMDRFPLHKEIAEMIIAMNNEKDESKWSQDFKSEPFYQELAQVIRKERLIVNTQILLQEVGRKSPQSMAKWFVQGNERVLAENVADAISDCVQKDIMDDLLQSGFESGAENLRTTVHPKSPEEEAQAKQAAEEKMKTEERLFHEHLNAGVHKIKDEAIHSVFEDILNRGLRIIGKIVAPLIGKKNWRAICKGIKWFLLDVMGGWISLILYPVRKMTTKKWIDKEISLQSHEAMKQAKDDDHTSLLYFIVEDIVNQYQPKA